MFYFHQQYIPIPSFRTANPAVIGGGGGGGGCRNHSNIETVLIKRQPTDSPRNTSIRYDAGPSALFCKTAASLVDTL